MCRKPSESERTDSQGQTESESWLALATSTRNPVPWITGEICCWATQDY